MVPKRYGPFRQIGRLATKLSTFVGAGSMPAGPPTPEETRSDGIGKYRRKKHATNKTDSDNH